jgi:hypothetical protein
MATRNQALDEMALSRFASQKVLTVADLMKVLSCSLITVRRRLAEWDAHTSYNKNGRYYTLPAIPTFEKNGIWCYRDVCFSRYGSLKNTVIALAARSKAGLTHTELQQIIGMNPKCFMARFTELAGIKKERHKNHILYFSSDPEAYAAQKRNRFPPEPSADALPSEAQAILILVELIHRPGLSIDELVAQLRRKGHAVQTEAVVALFDRYRIKKTEYGIVALLRGIIDRMVRGVTAVELFPTPVMIHFKPQERAHARAVRNRCGY